LRGGNAGSARGPAGFATGTIIVRIDSGYNGANVIAAVRRAGARFSVTVPTSADGLT
jgi:hypothetical protein